MKFSKKKLKNGLRCIYVPMSHTETVLVMVLVGTGADFETREENGLAHFLEHMCFKGTSKRPAAKDISLELDNIGADYNAFTGREYTGYYARAHKKHASHLMDIVSDISLNSIFPKEEIQKEQGVVIQEINMYMDEPRYRVEKLSTNLLYGDQPAGREIIGTKESVSSFTREDLIKYHGKFYNAKNALVIVAGNFKQTAMEKEVQRHFEGMKPGKKAVSPKAEVSQDKPQVSVEYRDTDQTHLILSFRAFGFLDKRTSALRSLSSAVGGSMSSRLYHALREELGICYYVGSGVSSRYDAGVFNISAGVANERVDEALEGIIAQLQKLKKEGITAEELKKVTEGRLSALVLHLETTEDYADFYGREEILRGKITTPAEYEKRVSSVTLKAANALIKDIFDKNKASLALVGPFKEAGRKRFEEIISRI